MPCIGSTWPRCTTSRSTSSRDHHEAEDATERTFLSALAGLDRFEERARPSDGAEASTFRIWLFRIARNVVAERRRGAAPPTRRPRSSRGRDRCRPARRRAEAVVQRRGAAAAWRAVDRLTGDRRRAVVLRFVHEMSTAEIAAILGRSEGAVRVLIHRALRSRRAATSAPRIGTVGDRRARHAGRRDRGASSSIATSTRCSPGDRST